jgi:DNA-binding NarL/FixJ family response regulator
MPAEPPASDGHLRLVLVDADDLVRETIAALLAIGDRIEVVGSAGSVGPALDLVTAAQPDVVMVDPRLPDFDGGLAFIRKVHQVAPVARVLVACTPEFLDRAAATEGVDGCFRKTFRPDDLTAAIVAASRPATA